MVPATEPAAEPATEPATEPAMEPEMGYIYIALDVASLSNPASPLTEPFPLLTPEELSPTSYETPLPDVVSSSCNLQAPDADMANQAAIVLAAPMMDQGPIGKFLKVCVLSMSRAWLTNAAGL
jgi:hypothetical protein